MKNNEMAQKVHPELKVLGLDHLSILVADAEKSLSFYQELLGLQIFDRPALGFPGYWLDLGAGQTLHLMQVDNPYNQVERPAHGGRDFHFALRVSDVASCQRLLEAKEIPYTSSKSGRKALFFRDLDQNVIELFENDE